MPGGQVQPGGNALTAAQQEMARRKAAADLARQYPNGTPLDRAAGTVKDIVTAPAELVGTLKDPNTWVRVGKVLAGTVLLAAGVASLARPLAAATPAGMVIRAVGKAK